MTTRFLALLLSCSFALAGPWEDFVQARGQRARAVWTLCVAEKVLTPGDLLGDEAYLRLATAGDWEVSLLGKAETEDLRIVRGAQWALLAPGGAVAGAGKGKPTGAALLDAIHAAGGRPTWEARAAFLQEHSDQGEARVDALVQEMRMVLFRLTALDSQGQVRVPGWHAESGEPSRSGGRVTLEGPRGDALAEDVYRGLGEALGRLVQVPGWTRGLAWVIRALEGYDLAQSMALRRLLGSMARELEDRAAADPGDLELLRAWVEAQDLVQGAPDALAARIIPVPGTLWPSPEGLAILLKPLQRRRDFDRLLKLLADLTPQAPPDPPSPRGWEDHCGLQAALHSQRAAVLAQQGAWGPAQAALDEARTWGGDRTTLRRALLGWSSPGGDSPSPAWNRLLAPSPSPRPVRPSAPPVPPVLVLTLLGRPPWLVDWAALRDAPELAPWSPGELRWEIAAPAEARRLQALRGWSGKPRWVLSRGGDVLATGEACPGAPALAAVVAAQGTPLLERLGRMLVRNPAHLAARRARFALVLKRMPDPRLEPLLAEDAAAAGLALPFTPREAWKPDAALWGAAAQRVLPDLEDELHSWPSDEGLWQAWASWARFHPARPSIIERAESLSYWGPGEDWRASLPFGVLRIVAAELRRQGHFLAMGQWFQAAWDRLDRRPLKDLRPWERVWILKRREEERTAIFEPLRDALMALGQVEQQLDLERTFAAMAGGGGKASPLAR